MSDENEEECTNDVPSQTLALVQSEDTGAIFQISWFCPQHYYEVECHGTSLESPTCGQLFENVPDMEQVLLIIDTHNNFAHRENPLEKLTP